MSPDLEKVHESAREVRFAHPHRGGWLGVVFGAGLAALGWSGFGGWLLTGFGVLVALLGLGSALHRMELTLDLARRRYRYRRGNVFSSERGEGDLADVEVVLKKELERKDPERVDEWEVELAVKGWARPFEVAESKDEATARREAEALARRLGVTLRERTGH